MSSKSTRTLADCAKHGCLLLGTCPKCARTRYMAPDELMRPADPRVKPVRGWWDTQSAARLLRCRCGQKGVAINVIVEPRRLAPPGVPILAFLNADDRERKRMIRRARG